MPKTEKENEEKTSNVKILDWMADDYAMEVTEGIKFDPDKDYTFELTEIKREHEDEHDDKKESNRLKLVWTEHESGVNIRQTHFLNPKLTKNKDDSSKSNSLVKLALGLGYKVDVGDKAFHPKHFLRPGMKIVAHVVDQINNKTKEKTGFSEIDLTTVRPAGKSPQKDLGIDPALISKWQAEVTKGKFAKAELFVAHLASTGGLADVAPFMEAAKAGKINFA